MKGLHLILRCASAVVHLCLACLQGVLRWSFRLALVAVIGFGVVLLAAWQDPLALPDRAVHRVAQGLTDQVAPMGLVATLAGADIGLTRMLAPVIRLQGLRLSDPRGETLLRLTSLDLVLSRDDALIGRAAPVTLAMTGLRLALQRDAQGRLTLTLGDAPPVERQASPAQVIADLRAAFDQPLLAQLRRFSVTDMRITLDDTRDGRRVTSEGGALTLTRDGPALAMSVDLGTLDDGGDGAPGGVTVQIDSPSASAATALRVSLRGLEPAGLRGLAGGGPLTGLLTRMRAPVSLDLRGGLTAAGVPLPLSGAMQVGRGLFDAPGPGIPISINGLRANLDLSSDLDHLTLSGLRVDSDAVGFRGRVDLRRSALGDITAQLALRNLRLALPSGDGDPSAQALRIERIWADLRHSANSGGVTLAALTLQQGDARLHGRGQITTAGVDAVAQIALDLSARDLDRAGLLALWPAMIAGDARDWVAANVIQGSFRDLRIALRHRLAGAGGGLDHLAIGFGYHDAALAPAPGLPPIRAASGQGALAANQLALTLEAGHLALPGTPGITLTEGVVQIADLSARPPAPIKAQVTAAADLGAAIALIQQPLFQPGEASPDTGNSPLMAPGAVRGAAIARLDLRLPRGPQHRRAPMDFDLTGVLQDVASDALLPGHALRAPRLEFTASPELVSVAGNGSVDGFPLSVRYTRPLRAAPHPERPRAPGQGLLTARLQVTDGLLRNFGVPVPRGALRGAGQADVRVDLGSGGAPALDLAVDLQGLGLSVPQLGLAKSLAAPGSLNLRARLGPGATFDTIELTFPGARLQARARLTPSFGLEALTLDRVVLGRWLDVRGQVTPNPAGGTRIALTGGTVDLRNLPTLRTGGGGGDRALWFDVALDRIHLTEDIAVTGVRGRVSPGLTGSFQGRVNDAVPVAVRLGPGQVQGGTSPARDGIALRLTGDDAGGMLRAAGLVPFLFGGAFDLRLVPDGPQGRYRGQLRVTDTALDNSPAAQEFAAAIAVVGAQDRVSPGGIRFDDVRADFTLQRDRIEIMAASATGAALGISLDGVIDMAARSLALQGVVSPMFFANRVGEFMTRRGEGLFGVHYTVTGPMRAPNLAVNLLSMLTPGFLREVFRGENEQP